MIADPQLKGLIPRVFHEHIAHMGVNHKDIVVQWELSIVLWISTEIKA